MFEEIPRGKFVRDKDLLKETTNFFNRIFKLIKKKSAKKKKSHALKEVGFTKLSYDDVKYNKDGWADATKYAPSRFEIVVLKTKNKMANGWYQGGEWFSRKWGKNLQVLQWKPSKEIFIGGPKDVG